MRRLACITLVMVAWALPVQAATKEELAQKKQEIEKAKAHKESIAGERKKLESELLALQEQLVRAAAQVQKGEADLSAVEEKIAVLNAQLTAKQEALEARRKNLASLVQAALKLSQTPPEAIVLMPGDSEKTMKAARALKMATSSIKEEAEAIQLQVAELERLHAKVAAQRDTLAERQKTYDHDRKALMVKMSERKKLQDKLAADEEDEAQRIAKLAKQAEDLEGLVSTIEKAQKTRAGRKATLEASTEAPKGRKGKVRSFAAAKGDIRPPVSGKVIQYFGSASGKNETSKGMVVLARPGANVTAPYDGEVVYAGSFLNYGRMVIIRHSDDFHTLLAGLAEIDTSAGEFLLEGEPIGAMGEKESSARLYIEIRKNNQPIDPAPWIK